jgi:hypothetical protein
MLRTLDGQKGYVDRFVERLEGEHDFEYEVTAATGIIAFNRPKI